MPIVPPIRYYFGDIDAPPVPVTYPSALIPFQVVPWTLANRGQNTVPSGPRKQLTGYDDE
jgi:hypothetical protein